MTEEDQPVKPAAERWFDEQRAWQQTMRDYADAMATDEQFLMHMSNAMRGSLLAGVPYPDATAPGAEAANSLSADRLDEMLFVLKRIEGRLRDLEDAVDALRAAPVDRTDLNDVGDDD